MRHSARVLSAAALAGAALGAVVPSASADPTAAITPRSAVPGGTVTVSVSCDATGAAPPDFIDATSQGFEAGRARLLRVDATDDTRAQQPAVLYSGTARIPTGGSVGAVTEAAGREAVWGVDGWCPVAPGSRQKPWDASFTVARDRAGQQGEGPIQLPGNDQAGGASQPLAGPPADDPAQQPGSAQGDLPPQSNGRQGAAGPPAFGNPFPSPGRPQGDGQDQWGKQRGDDQDGRRGDRDEGSGPPVGVQHGAHAGEGGAFGESVPMQIAGGFLIALALAAAVHRLWRRGALGHGRTL
ncbi:hypothetical protein [Streptomyces nodosus]|uniref:hypothetical protein n=1 Tax=Streptomyces nodosus TaxID=40318 RepID=UPI0038125DA5